LKFLYASQLVVKELSTAYDTVEKSRKIGMPTIQIELPDEVLLSLKETPESFTKVIRMAAAAKLYELGKLSSGRAADLAGLSRVRFLQALGQYGVPIFDLTAEELAQDLRNA
jgi:predicted HTH domain antitoxin